MSRATVGFAWLFAVGSIAVLAAIHVPFPFGGDQAMFVFGARELAEGARIYVDFWDMKQPGVFWFAQVAGSVFGFDPVGIHLAEAIWMTALAAAIVKLCLASLTNRWLAFLAPLVCLGPYYAATQHYYLTVVEMLVNLPMMAAILGALVRPEAPIMRRWAFRVSGAMVVVVALFKLMLAPVAAAVVLVLLLMDDPEARGPKFDSRLDRLRQATYGALACAALVCIYLWSQGALQAALWTSLVYPPQAVAVYPGAPLERLLRAFRWLWERDAWLIAAAVPGLLLMRGALRRPLVVLSVVWLLLGSIAIALQSLSWWIYHMTFLVVPVGLLALAGIDAGATWLGRVERSATRFAAVAVLLAIPLYKAVAAPLAWGVARPLLSQPPWAAASLFDYQASIEPALKHLRESAAFLDEPGALPGRIAMLGDQRILLFTKRRPVTSINGWSYYLPGQLETVASTLRCDRPPYVYRSRYIDHVLRNGSNAVFDVLDTHYDVLKQDAADGVWYVLKGGTAGRRDEAGCG